MPTSRWRPCSGTVLSPPCRHAPSSPSPNAPTLVHATFSRVYLPDVILGLIAALVAIQHVYHAKLFQPGGIQRANRNINNAPVQMRGNGTENGARRLGGD